jgi:outer membrane protein W
MKKSILLLLLISFTTYSYSQINVEANTVFGYRLKSMMKNWGYNATLGYMIKDRVNVGVQFEHTAMAFSFFMNTIDYSINSTQLKIQYHIIPVKYTFNPYIEVGAGVFKRVHKSSFNYPHYVDNSYGVSGALGALFRVHKKIPNLYINGKFKYQHVEYEFNKTKCINAEVGIFYLLSFSNKQAIKNTR